MKESFALVFAATLSLALCALDGCSPAVSSSSTRPIPEISTADASSAATTSPLDEAALRTIAAEYASWHRVDEWNHWAPQLCRIKPSQARISAADDASPHGRKLYYLYAKDRAAYMNCKAAAQPVGQVIVKESWVPVEASASDIASLKEGLAGLSLAQLDGKSWKPGEKQGLFVMTKFAAGTPGTDDGWVYATTSPDGSVVHASGKIASCMGCHDDDTHDRMFGLKQE